MPPRRNRGTPRSSQTPRTSPILIAFSKQATRPRHSPYPTIPTTPPVATITREIATIPPSSSSVEIPTRRELRPISPSTISDRPSILSFFPPRSSDASHASGSSRSQRRELEPRGDALNIGSSDSGPSTSSSAPSPLLDTRPVCSPVLVRSNEDEPNNIVDDEMPLAIDHPSPIYSISDLADGTSFPPVSINERDRGWEGSSPQVREPPSTLEHLTIEPHTDTESSDETASSSDRGEESDISDHDMDHSDEVEDQRLLAQELHHLLRGGDEDGGCTAEEHETEHRNHMSAEDATNHHRLSATFDAWDEVNGERTEFGLRSASFPPPRGVPRSIFPDRDVLQSLFEGRGRVDDLRQNICLHKEQEAVEPSTAQLVFDIDSFILTSDDLSFLRKGLEICPSSHVKMKVQSNIHLKHRILHIYPDGSERYLKLQYRSIPHVYFGRVTGLHHSAVYIFFPHLLRPNKEFTALRHAELQAFYDLVLWPACCLHLGTDNIQHIVPSYDLVEMNARAHSREQKLRGDGAPQKQYTHYPIAGQFLPDIWTTIRNVTSDAGSGAYQFRDCFFMVSSKGVKCHHKVAGSSFTAMQQFDRILNEHFDLDVCDPAWVDIGRERCGPYSKSYLGDPDPRGRATVRLWKRCCLEKISRRIHHFFPRLVGDYAVFYQPGYLRDAASMTISPPTTSKAYRQGLAYGQWYSSYKEPIDAQKVYPFQHPRLRELANDPAVGKAFASRKKIGFAGYFSALVQSYAASKERVRAAQASTQNVSFGDRMEVRVRYDLFRHIMELARVGEEEEEGEHVRPIRSPGHPSSVWVIHTDRLNAFFRSNYDKICGLIEFSIASSPTTGITLARTRLVTALFAYLQHFQSTHLPRHGILAIRRQVRRDGRTVRGIGLSHTMARSGFGWFDSVVDWEHLQFHDEIADEMIGVRRALVSWYRASAAHQLTDTLSELDNLLAWLGRPSISPTDSQKIISHLVHVLLRQYRRDVIAKLQDLNEISDTVLQNDDDIDDIYFCFDDFTRVMVNGFNLIKGNRIKTKETDQVMEWLWGPSEAHRAEEERTWNRGHWDELPYRLWWTRVREALKPYGDLFPRIEHHLHHEFWRYHWLIPYPTNDGHGCFTSTNKEGQRQMFGSERKTGQYQWTRDKRRGGHPEDYPATLRMTFGELREYFGLGP